MRRTKLGRRFATTAFGRAISMLYRRIYFAFTWKKREKALNNYLPCSGCCLTCKWFEKHEAELQFWEWI